MGIALGYTELIDSVYTTLVIEEIEKCLVKVYNHKIPLFEFLAKSLQRSIATLT